MNIQRLRLETSRTYQHNACSSEEVGLPTRLGELSGLVMMQTAIVAMTLSREIAGESDDMAKHIWEIWMFLLPEGIETTIQPPVPGATQKDRQQAVIWLALDVFSAHIAKADGEFAMQCKIVRTWREICNLLDDTEGMNKIHELMVGELGEVMADVALEMNSYGAQQ
ncbi:MAG: hypothetical protein Q9194_000427 [Teloschistes cf. exilis]